MRLPQRQHTLALHTLQISSSCFLGRLSLNMPSGPNTISANTHAADQTSTLDKTTAHRIAQRENAHMSVGFLLTAVEKWSCADGLVNAGKGFEWSIREPNKILDEAVHTHGYFFSQAPDSKYLPHSLRKTHRGLAGVLWRAVNQRNLTEHKAVHVELPFTTKDGQSCARECLSRRTPSTRDAYFLLIQVVACYEYLSACFSWADFTNSSDCICCC